MAPKLNEDPEAEGIPATADDDSYATPDHPAGREADGPSPAYMPSDKPVASLDFGTTAAEQRHGESLAGRLAREERRSRSEVDRGVGQLTAPDEGTEEDIESEAIASDRGVESGPSAEEQAMHLEEGQ